VNLAYCCYLSQSEHGILSAHYIVKTTVKTGMLKVILLKKRVKFKPRKKTFSLHHLSGVFLMYA
jgi:hypothetical protein